MTRYFCDARRCFPVVGGVLTHKDEGHITAAFGRSLAPFLAAKLRAIGMRRALSDGAGPAGGRIRDA